MLHFLYKLNITIPSAQRRSPKAERQVTFSRRIIIEYNVNPAMQLTTMTGYETPPLPSLAIMSIALNDRKSLSISMEACSVIANNQSH